MALDAKKLIGNLLSFYDFSGKTVLSVGAGGGQLIEYARDAKQVYAVDIDPIALVRLSENLVVNGLIDKFMLINADFEKVDFKADVVLFEFCLHEMADAKAAIAHAQTLSNDIVICDHIPSSDWAYCVDEDKKAEKVWDVLSTFPDKKINLYDTEQRFASYDELYNKVEVQGRTAISRIKKYEGCTNFIIPMKYTIAMLHHE